MRIEPILTKSYPKRVYGFNIYVHAKSAGQAIRLQQATYTHTEYTSEYASFMEDNCPGIGYTDGMFDITATDSAIVCIQIFIVDSNEQKLIAAKDKLAAYIKNAMAQPKPKKKIISNKQKRKLAAKNR